MADVKLCKECGWQIVQASDGGVWLDSDGYPDIDGHFHEPVAECVPVFGPGRARAAALAIARLESLRESYLNGHGTRRELREAESVREQYAEYGDLASAEYFA